MHLKNLLFVKKLIISCFLQALRGRRRENKTGNRDSETMENREVRVLTRAGRIILQVSDQATEGQV